MNKFEVNLIVQRLVGRHLRSRIVSSNDPK